MQNVYKHGLIVFFSAFCLLVGLHLSRAGSSNPPENVPPLPSPLYDPESYSMLVERNRDACTEDECRWWYDYVWAKYQGTFDKKKACTIFTELSERNGFVPHLLALARRAETCAYDSNLSLKTLEKIKEVLRKEKLRPWLYGLLSESALNAAIQAPSENTPAAEVNPDKTAAEKIESGKTANDILDYALQASRVSHSKKLRVDSLQKALGATKSVTSEDLIKKRASVEEELYRISPRLKPVGTTDDTPETWYSIGIDSASQHDYAGAIKAFERVLKFKQTSIVMRRSGFENLKSSYKALQKKEEAFAVTKRWYFWELSLLRQQRPPPEQPKHVLSAGLGYARFIWTEHESKKALTFLAKLEKTLKKSSLNLSELYFVRARIKEELRQTPGAVAWMKKAVQAADPPVKGQYGWAAAWIDYKENRFTSAQTSLEELLLTETDNGRRSQEMFWLAKAYDQLKNSEKKQYWLEKIIQDDPLSYYSLLAYREMNRAIPKASLFDFSEATKIPRLEEAPQKTLTPLFQWLVSLGEIQWAQDLLEDEFPLPEPSEQIPEELFLAYSEADLFAPIFSRVNKATAAEKEKILYKHPDFLFPRLFRPSVESASGQSGISTSYIFSIMRQESSFDPLAVSGANAYGLLQLLPSVAQSLAQKIGAPYHSPEDLLDPSLNIMLGAQHLRNYWEEFDGQFILATAAYNASPETVKTWVRTRYQGDALKFIEDIPYDETRIYVKLVLRNFIRYLLLDSSESILEFPEWCLEGIQAAKD